MVALDVERIPGRKLIRYDLPTGIRLCLAEYEPGVICERRTCPDGQFWLILQGGWRLTDEHSSNFQDGPLSFRYFRPHEKNRRIVGYSGAKLIGMQVLNRRLTELGLADCERVTDLQIATRTIAQLARELQLNDTHTAANIDILCHRVVRLLTHSESRSATQEKWIAEVREYLNANVSRNVTMKELSCQVNIHPVYLGATFAKVEGCTVGEYLRRMRLQQAARELTETQEDIGQIGVNAGFYDHAHFNRIFRAYLGMPPKEFRRLATHGPTLV